MAEITYLWKNRAVFPVGSQSFFRAWAKRTFSFYALVKRNNARRKLVRHGAVIHSCAEIGEIKAEGDKKNLRVGAFSFIGRVELALHDRIEIGERVCINDGVLLLTASHSVTDPLWRHVKKPIVIEDYAWVATNAIILPGVRIGRGAVVGAGAVVAKDIGPGEIVIGNPCIVTGKKRVEDLNYNPCEFIAANRAWLIG